MVYFHALADKLCYLIGSAKEEEEEKEGGGESDVGMAIPT